MYQLISVVTIGLGCYACNQSYYMHHAVRMVDAKSYLDHPVSASLYYYR
jgi:hypothetical protein